MPNWTYNTLQISGNKEMLADFISKQLKLQPPKIMMQKEFLPLISCIQYPKD
jgi:hypothetical protein